MKVHLIHSTGIQPERKEIMMKRCSGLIMAMGILVFALVMAGCSQKQEAPAPAAKSAQGPLNMQEGQWEITTSFEMPGMPAGMAKPHIVTTCLSRKDYVPQDTKQQTDCTMKDTKVEGNTVTWSVVCKDSTARGRVTYAGTTYDGVVDTTMKQDGKEMTTKMTMKGKYLGPCPKQN
jgi:hypothetical protein